MHALNDSLPHPAAASVRVAYRHAPLDMLLADTLNNNNSE